MTLSLRLSLIASAALLAVLGGCQSNPEKVDVNSILSDLTPELKATSERPVDMDVNYAVNADQNLRGVWNDLGRFWLTDRPSALSPFPIHSASGQP